MRLILETWLYSFSVVFGLSFAPVYFTHIPYDCFTGIVAIIWCANYMGHTEFSCMGHIIFSSIFFLTPLHKNYTNKKSAGFVCHLESHIQQHEKFNKIRLITKNKWSNLLRVDGLKQIQIFPYWFIMYVSPEGTYLIQCIPRSMPMVYASLCFVVVRYWSILPISFRVTSIWLPPMPVK